MRKTVTGRLPGRKAPVASGRITIPASKSHTIRALLTAAFAEGESRLIRPLSSKDAESCRRAVEALGAIVTESRENGGTWIVNGAGSRPDPQRKTINVGNSGTTLYLATALASLSGKPVTFDGDEQIRRRSALPLLNALEELGVKVKSSENGCAPYTVQGPIRNGREVEIDCPVSQYLSALLLALPLVQENPDYPEIKNRTLIKIKNLNEAPYAQMTMDWLDFHNIKYVRDGWKTISIPAGQKYRSFTKAIPSDWSSASFFLCAAAITGGTLTIDGLDYSDSQGDKAVLDMLEKMGCRTEVFPGTAEKNPYVTITGGPMHGAVLDLNDTPDALPVMAATACFAEGETRLVNVPQARLKETDRIAVMAAELRTLGADIDELPDGLVIRGKGVSRGLVGCDYPVLKGALVNGHSDHRVVMALAVAALGTCGEVTIRSAEAADITFPGFFELLENSVIRE